MTSAPNLTLVSPTSSAASSVVDAPLQALFDNRDALLSEFSRLGALGTRRAEAEAALSRIDDDMRASDEAEAARWREWSEKPDQAQPTPRREERRKLAAKRADAAADLDVARVAEASTLPRQRALAAELGRVRNAILSLQVDRAVAEAHEAHTKALDIAARILQPMMEIAGLREFLRVGVDRAIGDGELERASMFGTAFEAIAGLTSPIVNGDPTTLAREAARWRNQIE